MTVLDANFILRAAVRPATAADETMHASSSRFFQLAASGLEEFTTTEAVLAEVAFVLEKHYAAAHLDIVKRIRFLLFLRGCKLDSKARCLATLDRWEANPRSSFVDCLVAELARAVNAPLATYDQALTKSAGVVIWSDAGLN